MLAKIVDLFKARSPQFSLSSERSFHDKCVDAAEVLAGRGYDADVGKILAFYPRVKRNPFQQMLYSSGYEKGFASFQANTLEELLSGPAGMQLIVHYHWLYDAIRGANSVREAKGQITKFLETVRKQKEVGHSVVWTIHNILSHGSAFPEEEAYLRGEMAALVDHIHIMNPNTVDLCAPYYDISAEKTFHVPHPSYHRVYADYVGKADARHSLGLNADNKVFLLFGNMMPQKGGLRFLEQLDALQKSLDGKARVLIAGKATDQTYMAKVQALVRGRTDVQLHQKFLSDDMMQTYFKAADVVVCPYAITLNSGVVMTAASFGRPVVAPQSLHGVLDAVGGQTVTYDIEDMQACVAACLKAVDIGEIADTETVLKNWAQGLSPNKVSNRFFEALRARL